MASLLAHGAVALAAGRVYTARPMPRRFWAMALLLSVSPDFDVVGFAAGIEYGDAGNDWPAPAVCDLGGRGPALATAEASSHIDSLGVDPFPNVNIVPP